ncbi:unnamed protein product [Soboliphyme baturini]|uniref:CS domain-containing protein n=1 Tax=Soboliphyme baturini TaxID=241478 RepID=A0A183I9S9_9BILA|nr:unnamed protein product [Soboliphyme baturini]
MWSEEPDLSNLHGRNPRNTCSGYAHLNVIPLKKTRFLACHLLATWDQSDTYVKFYINLAGVQDIPTENIEATFLPRSLHLRVHNLNGKDYEFDIIELSNSILPPESTFKVSSAAFSSY